MEVSGSIALPSMAAMTRGVSKSASQLPTTNGVAVLLCSTGRTDQEPGIGSHKSSSSVRSFHARFSVNISMKSIISSNVSARRSATG
jgi:hypothetical protein